jgi:MFS family permease
MIDAVLDTARSLLTEVDPGLAAADDLTVAFVTAVALMLAWIAVKFIADIARDAGKFAKDQVEAEFWRDPGKIRIVIGFVLLAVAYGFYGTDQSRPLGEAVLDLGRSQFLAVMPLAILTQWLLLIAFWLLFGLLMGVPFRELAKPIGTVISGTIVIGVELILFTIGALSLIGGSAALGIATLTAAFLLNLVLGCISVVIERRKPVEARATGFWRTNPIALALLVTLAIWVVFVLSWLLVALVHGIYLSLTGGEPQPLTLESAIRGDLIALSVIFLFSCFRFRADTLSEVETPPSLLYFADLSLALSAAVIAATGLPNSPVVLGPVPPWVVAVGPPSIVAALVFGVYLIRMRETTPRWALCLAVSLAAAFLVVPTAKALTGLLAPVLPQINPPF